MNIFVKRIFFSLIFIITFIFLPFYLKAWKEKRKSDKKFNITLLIQTGPEKEALKSLYLEELMGLSIDKPINIYAFDEKEAKKRLLLSPVIEKAVVKKIKPSAVYVDYKVKDPVALLYDLKNVAIDKKGYIFPTNFFAPKNLPEIYLGNTSFLEEKDFWQKPLISENVQLALKILKILDAIQDGSFIIKRIDVSNMFASYGKREIVLILEHFLNVSENGKEITLIFPRILRLPFRDLEKQLGNYFILQDKMARDYKKQIDIKKDLPPTLRFASKTVDLRISKLAFVDQ